jgi:hypothetical protein
MQRLCAMVVCWGMAEFDSLACLQAPLLLESVPAVPAPHNEILPAPHNEILPAHDPGASVAPHNEILPAHAHEPGASVAQHVEVLRVFLEQELGTGKFLELYRRMDEMHEAEEYDAEELLGMVQPEHKHCIRMVQQLILVEKHMHAVPVPAE